MFIPLHDTNSLKYIRAQYVTIGLIVVNVLVYLVTGFASTQTFSDEAVVGLGYIPAVVFGYADLEPNLVIVPETATYLTYAFLHGDFMHLASNMLFLWVFGDNVEDALGHVRFLVFYLLCAASGALLHGITQPDSEFPLIGASGAISGIVSAYFLLHPRVRVWVLVLFRIPLPLPAVVPLAFWIAQQFYMLFVDQDNTVSWGAHVGGIVAGAILVVVLRRPGVPLFDRSIVTPRAVRHAEGAATGSESLPTDAARTPPPRWGR
ncbi:rhomboid family intramembrane serine protease [Sinorhizobium sp. BG8]|uniref:rhomboid family intramembrane serine protease n=1 Tax=Sinorhizobium sp. BG8 TaxID=2613773 RepID=UPI00193DA56C|nr:rhomboid family intramembrane serine protease [Sinorhizobium sp. BG8]QRM53391.1 rhomboid family intramembrane serine protease [Sinorhizobium sp. BG8]